MLLVAAHDSMRSEVIHQTRLDGVDKVQNLAEDAVQELCFICEYFWKEELLLLLLLQ